MKMIFILNYKGNKSCYTSNSDNGKYIVVTHVRKEQNKLLSDICTNFTTLHREGESFRSRETIFEVCKKRSELQ